MSKKTVGLEPSIKNIDVKQIHNPKFRARVKINDTAFVELVNSIKTVGLINPCTVKSCKGGYEIVAGERRFLALKKLGRKQIPCILVEGDNDKLEIIKFEENMKRDDLTDVEEALSIKHVLASGKLNQSSVAKMIGRSLDYIKQKLAILDYPDYLYNALLEKKISFSACRELNRITDKDILREYVKHAIRSGITPSLAKQWADDFFESKKTNNEEYESVGGSGEAATFEAVKLPCHICHSFVTVQESIMVRVCNDCRKDLKV